MNITFTKNKDTFYLLQKSNTNVYVKFEKAILLVRKCTISPSVLLAHSLALEKATAKFPIKRVLVNTYTIASNLASQIIPSINTGPLPTRVVIGFVDSESFNGNYEKNPFNFHHFNINKLSLTVDSKEVTYYQGLTFDLENNEYIRGYNTLFEGIDKPVFTNGNFISRADYPNGYALFAYDLSPDLCSGDHFNVLRKGNLAIEVNFEKSLTKPITVVVLTEYDNMIEINSQRQLFMDYKQ